MKHLPAGYEAASRETGAMRRQRGVVKTPPDLMWLLLLHLLQGQTLANMAAISQASGIGKISDVAVMKRLMNSGGWFKWILQRLGGASVADYLKPRGFENYRVLAVDTSDVRSGVSNFSKSWHLHYALDLFTLASHEFTVTGNEVGETLTNFTARKGDLFLADRAYATKKVIRHCLSHGADFILRLRAGAFTVYSRDGARLDLLGQVRAAGTNRAVDVPVLADLDGDGIGETPLRVCAVRKSEQDIGKAMGRIDRRDSKGQKATSAEARQFNGYVAVVTSLPPGVPADDVLAAYRYRWQVELYFKRLKSLLGMGEVPKKRDECMEAWLNGKMILAVLFEILLSKLDFSPLGHGREESA